MSEKKKRLGVIIDKETGEQLEMVAALAMRCKGDRRVSVSRTEIGSYALMVYTPDENGDMREQQMHLSELDFSALLNGIFCFLGESGMDIEEFADRSVDESSGFLYKTIDDVEEELKEGTESCVV